MGSDLVDIQDSEPIGLDEVIKETIYNLVADRIAGIRDTRRWFGIRQIIESMYEKSMGQKIENIYSDINSLVEQIYRDYRVNDIELVD